MAASINVGIGVRTTDADRHSVTNLRRVSFTNPFTTQQAARASASAQVSGAVTRGSLVIRIDARDSTDYASVVSDELLPRPPNSLGAHHFASRP